MTIISKAGFKTTLQEEMTDDDSYVEKLGRTVIYKEREESRTLDGL